MNNRLFGYLDLAIIISLLAWGCAGPQIPAPNTTQCTVAGRLFLGLDCAEVNTGKISTLSYQETIDFLEPQPERSCVPVLGFSVCADNQGVGTKVKLKARAGAVIESDDDFTRQKTAFEQACTELKDRCTPEMKAAFQNSTGIVDRLLKGAQEKKKAHP